MNDYKSKSSEGEPSRCGKLGFRGTHNPQIVSSILTSGIDQDKDGYYYLSSKKDCKPIQSKKVKEDIKNITILDTGGTITSTPDQKSTGVASGLDSLEKKEWKDLMNELGPQIGLSQVGAKNSEKYLWEDYLQIKKKLDMNPNRMWIVTHGTDNIAFASSFLALCAKDSNSKIILVACARSMDRPTWQGGRLIKCALNLVKKIKGTRCYCLSYYDVTRLSLHIPFEVRKIHTYHKNCLDSLKKIVFRDEFPPSCPKYYVPSVCCWEPNAEPISYITPFTKDAPFGQVLSYGIGNLPPHIDVEKDIGSRVTQGPSNSYIYGRENEEEKANYSIEAKYLLKALKAR